MTDPKPEIDKTGRIARWAGLVLLASLLFPAVRRTVAGFGLWGIAWLLLMFIGLLGFGIYRLIRWTASIPAADENPFACPTGDADTAWRLNESGATLELCGPALRRRYPWRH
jgi:hypothetical protein